MNLTHNKKEKNIKNSPLSTCNVGDLGSIPGSGRSPGEGKGYPLQYSGLENSIDSIVCGVAKSQTRLSDFHFTSLHLLKLCHQMATLEIRSSTYKIWYYQQRREINFRVLQGNHWYSRNSMQNFYTSGIDIKMLGGCLKY